jgi:hypothetical protein
MNFRNLVAFVVFLGFASFAQAKMFRNAYLAFELPEGWNCGLEATEWICRNQEPKSSKEAIIIFTAKEVGPTDSYSIYEQTINTPRTVTDKTGKGVVSTVVMKAKQTKINDHLWVDGMQKGSEIPNYFTRYVATLKEKIAILVTFSAHADYFAKYSTDFFKAIQSLRVIASKNLLAQPSGGTSGAPNTSGVWGAASSAPGGLSMTGEAPFGKRKKSGSNNLTYILATLGALLAAAGAFFLLKTRR